MNIEKQCCNIEYAEKLKELGVLQESLFYHTHSGKWGIMPRQSIDFSGNPTSAFTCGELVQMTENIYNIHFSDIFKKYYSIVLEDIIYYETFADALAAKLIRSIENEWINVDEVNNRLIS